MQTPLHLVAALLAAAWPAPAQDRGPAPDRLVVHLDWEPGVLGGSPPRRVALEAVPPAGVTLPPGLGAPFYATLALADGRLAVALDARPGRPRLWVDRDLDGDLAEERTTHLTAQGSAFSRTQVVLARYEGEAEPAPLELTWTSDPTASPPTLAVRLGTHRRGRLVLAGRLRQVALVDGDADGRFDDPERDRVYVDLDGDGELRAFAPNDERVRAGDPFRVADEGWVVRVATPSGRVLELERSATVPPEVPRAWPGSSYRPVAGAPRRARQESPAQPLAALLERFATERALPAAQRSATLARIGDLGSPEAFDALVKIAESEEKDVATRAAALRALGNPDFLAQRGARLAALARDADAQSAAALAQALFEAGHPDRDAIYVAQVESADGALVTAGARWLAYGGTEQATRAIVKAVEKGASPAVRLAAYRDGARNLPGGPPVDTALRAARDDDRALRALALEDLRVLGHADALALALEAAAERPVDAATGTTVCKVLGAAGTPVALRAVLGMLEEEGLPAAVRKAAVDELRLVRRDDSVEVLVKALRAKEAAVRAVAAEVLADVPERWVTVELDKRADKERDDEVLRLMLEALGDHGDALALSTLIARSRDKRPEVRAAAVRGLARLGFHHDKVRAFFLALLESGEWVDRMLALDAAREARDARLLPKVLRSLDHDQWQVRLAAVETLAALRAREVVLPLIERLEGEESQRVRDTIARSLFELTGVNGFDNLAIWRRWWADHGETFAVPEEVPVLPERSADSTSAGFYGIPVETERVVFLIDQSGSMSAVDEEGQRYGEQELDRLDVAVREALGALAKLDDRAKVNVILFHSTIHPWQDELQRLGPNRKRIEQELASKQPTGGTNIYDGLELALRMKDVDTIFLLSDGAPGAGKFVATPDILRAVRRENQTRRIAIHCVAIGMESQLLRSLAAENGGRYVRR